MVDELLDLVDKNDKVIDTVWKSKAHNDPALIHREIAVGVFNDKGEVLIQQRSLKKVNGPGKWEITAAGHVGAGEDPEKAAKREVYEELGIKIKPMFFGKMFKERKGKQGYTESRFFYIYYAIVKGRLEVKLDKEEVEDARWIDPDDLVMFAKDNYWNTKGPSNENIMDIGNSVINK